MYDGNEYVVPTKRSYPTKRISNGVKGNDSGGVVDGIVVGGGEEAVNI